MHINTIQVGILVTTQLWTCFGLLMNRVCEWYIFKSIKATINQLRDCTKERLVFQSEQQQLVKTKLVSRKQNKVGIIKMTRYPFNDSKAVIIAVSCYYVVLTAVGKMSRRRVRIPHKSTTTGEPHTHANRRH